MEAMKIAVRETLEILLEMFNGLLNARRFPEEARVVLMWKEGGPFNSPNAYKPICLLPSLVKHYETLIKEQIEETMEAELNEQQYGCRKG